MESSIKLSLVLDEERGKGRKSRQKLKSSKKTLLCIATTVHPDRLANAEKKQTIKSRNSRGNPKKEGGTEDYKAN